MVRGSGEARFDPAAGKWFYVIYDDEGQVLSESELMFDSQADAEAEMIYLLKRLAKLAPAACKPPR